MKAILITGTPGTGKTTVSTVVAERLRACHIELTAYARGLGLISRRDEGRGSDIVDVSRAKRRVMDLVAGGEGYVVVDGHFSPDVIDGAAVERVFVLRRAPWLLADELAARGYPPPKVRENVEAELVGICLSEALAAQDPAKVCELDTTGRTHSETVDAVVEVLEGTRPCGYGGIDWMGRPEAEALVRRLC